MQRHGDGDHAAHDAQPDHEPVMNKHGDDTSTYVAGGRPSGRPGLARQLAYYHFSVWVAKAWLAPPCAAR